MPKRHVVDVIEGKWLPWAKKERWICCDCSLVHDVEYRTHNGQLELRMFRSNRSTAAFRREHDIKVTNGNHRNGRSGKR
jgi:hypothetical protein